MPIETPTWRALHQAQNWRSALRHAATIELENEFEFSIAAKYWLQGCLQKNSSRGFKPSRRGERNLASFQYLAPLRVGYLPGWHLPLDSAKSQPKWKNREGVSE